MKTPEVSLPSWEKLQPALTMGRRRMLLRIMEANIIFLRPEQSITNARSDQEGNSNATVAPNAVANQRELQLQITGSQTLPRFNWI